jgi:hypothetical protein
MVRQGFLYRSQQQPSEKGSSCPQNKFSSNHKSDRQSGSTGGIERCALPCNIQRRSSPSLQTAGSYMKASSGSGTVSNSFFVQEVQCILKLSAPLMSMVVVDVAKVA